MKWRKIDPVVSCKVELQRLVPIHSRAVTKSPRVRTRRDTSVALAVTISRSHN